MANGRQGVTDRTGLHLNWAMAGVLFTGIVAGASFAISLGTVQTHVIINTEALRVALEDITKLKQIDAMHQARLDQHDKQLTEHREEDKALADKVERIRLEFTSRQEAQQLLTQGLTELHIEIKRVDQRFDELFADLQTYKNHQLEREKIKSEK